MAMQKKQQIIKVSGHTLDIKHKIKKDEPNSNSKHEEKIQYAQVIDEQSLIEPFDDDSATATYIV